MSTKTLDYQALAEKAVKATADELSGKHGPVGYHGDLPLGETWAMTIARNRDSEILTISNFDTISEDMQKRFSRDATIERFSHWGPGWVDYLMVRMLDKQGKVTKAGKAILEWKDKLEDYPIADEDDLSRREFEATIDNIKSEGGIDDKEAGEVYGWLSHNDSKIPDKLRLHSTDDGSEWVGRRGIDYARYQMDHITLREFDEDYLERMQDAVSGFKGDAGSIRQRMRDAGCTEVTIELMRRPNWEDNQVFVVADNGDYVYGFPPEPA
jgi:hypothetical protein